MKTIIHTNLTDEQRTIAAQRLFKRSAPIKRAELTEFVNGCIEQLVAGHQVQAPASQEAGPPATGKLDMIDPEDQERLAGETPGFIRGWNMMKQRGRS